MQKRAIKAARISAAVRMGFLAALTFCGVFIM
jgi:hypothetical protein